MKSFKILSLIMCFVMLLSVMPSFAVLAENGETTIITCSDFQATAGSTAGMINMKNILTKIKGDGITSADGLFFCGDYDVDTYGDIPSTKEGIKFMKMALSGMVPEKNMVLVQGNHDAPAGAVEELSPSGKNDAESGEYGVYVIHQDDYMWYNNDENTIKRTAEKLIRYLNEKLEEGYDKPIFVLSHLPMHYSMRTIIDGDAKYASYIFNALNEAGKKGLNIFYLYGHDHSNGWDDYLGGAAVFLKKGDKILIAKNSTTLKDYQTLNFTYMNAGYVGYYKNPNGVDDALTMSVIKIKGDEVTFTRYDKDGVHNMKSEGVTNAYKNEKGYSPDKTVYPSPQKVELTKVSDSTPIKSIMEINDFGMQFNKVDDPSKLVDGGKYVLVHNAFPDHFLIPEVITKSDSAGAKRTGFNVLRTSEFGDSAAYGDFQKYEWTFTKSGDGWLLGNGEGYVSLENTTDQKIKATFEKEGNVFKITGGTGAFVFESGAYSFNYNARGLINAFTSDPAKFYIYEYVGYSVGVINGSAASQGKEVTYAKPGDTVTVTADSAPAGMEFDCWKIVKGEASLDLSSPEVSFVMGENGIKLEAVYKTMGDVTVTPEGETDEAPEKTPSLDPTPDDEEKDGNDTVLVIVVVIVAAACFGGAAYIVVKKAKNKKK
ncbi:MAG: hypothetical protein E7675_03155 [Ruminococcaceae bacterium]|nr:hypothetical protein [Oscillospiraceae bacterium]